MAKPIPDDLLAEARSILIVKPSSFGDIIHTLPSLAAICDAHPHLEARWIINAGWENILHDHPNLTEVLPFPRKQMRGLGMLPKFFKWGKSLRTGERKRPEVVLDFQGLLRSAMMTKFRRSEASIGLSDAREGARHFYRHVVNVDPAAHAIERYLEIPRALGVDIPDKADLRYDLPAGDPLDSEIDLPDQFVLLHPYSRGQGKSLTDDQIVELTNLLAPHPVVLIGQREEGTPSSPFPPHLLDLANATSIPQLIGLMRKAAFTVSVDSGPMHLAVAVDGSRVLGIHTWTDPRKVGPYHPLARVWKAGEIRAYDAWTDDEASQSILPGSEAIQSMAAHIQSQLQ